MRHISRPCEDDEKIRQAKSEGNTNLGGMFESARFLVAGERTDRSTPEDILKWTLIIYVRVGIGRL
jgi:hypothetical protein